MKSVICVSYCKPGLGDPLTHLVETTARVMYCTTSQTHKVESQEPQRQNGTTYKYGIYQYSTAYTITNT